MTDRGFEPLKHTHAILSRTPLTTRVICQVIYNVGMSLNPFRFLYRPYIIKLCCLVGNRLGKARALGI